MPRTISLLDRVRIASPCNVSWESMMGDDRKRHCDQCNLNVYNLADMPRAEAEHLVATSEGRLCIRMHVRSDGTYLAQNCPVGVRLARRAALKVAGIAAVILGALAQAASFALMQRPGTLWLKWQQPLASVLDRLDPPPHLPPMMGAMMILPAPSGTHRVAGSDVNGPIQASNP